MKWLQDVCLVTVFLCFFMSPCWCAPEAELITDLPGLQDGFPLKMYSGFLNGTGTKRIFYWFIESLNNSKDAPVVLWIQGGPGASSLGAMATINGPFNWNTDGTITYKSQTWCKYVSMLYIETPPGNGFSYARTDAEYITSDNKTAEDNHLAMRHFFLIKFPELRKNPFYVFGESYGTTSAAVLAHSIVSDPDINFQGLGMGNGQLNSMSVFDAAPYVNYGRGIINHKMFTQVLKDCCTQQEKDFCPFLQRTRENPECYKSLEKSDVLRDYSGLPRMTMYDTCINVSVEPNNLTVTKIHQICKQIDNGEIPTTLANFACAPASRKMLIDVGAYINNPNFKRALHVDDYVMNRTWQGSVAGLLNYTMQYSTNQGVLPLLKQLTKMGKRILLYFGDTDVMLPYQGAVLAVESLQLQETISHKEWLYEANDGSQQVGGFGEQKGSLTLLSVMGAGHFVPLETPEKGLHLVKQFTQNKDIL